MCATAAFVMELGTQLQRAMSFDTRGREQRPGIGFSFAWDTSVSWVALFMHDFANRVIDCLLSAEYGERLFFTLLP